MSTPNGQWMSSHGGGGDGGFFSVIQGFLGEANKVVAGVGELWKNASPIWTKAGQQTPPPQQTYNGEGNAGGSTSAAVVGGTDWAKMMPWIIGGGVVLIVGVVALKS